MTLFLKLDSYISDKPISLSVKDYLIRKMSVKLMLSEKVIDSVISHQFQNANQAMINNKSVEISGFGKFFFNAKKAVKTLEKQCSKKVFFETMLQNPSLSETKRKSLTVKLENTVNAINELKPKVDAITNLRGMEEQFVSSKEDEGNN